jgi:hypothetical protein
MKKTNKRITTAPPEDFTTLHGVNLSMCLKGTKNTGLSSEAFLSFLSLKRQVDDAARRHQEDVKELMEGYKITTVFRPSEGGHVWDYKKHPKQVEIQKKLDAINNKPIILVESSFIKKEEFFKFTSGMDMDQVSMMAKYLLKDELKKPKEFDPEA